MTVPSPRPQLSLPGQAHVAEGPHDQTGMYLMHHAFRRDLAAFEAAVRHTPVRDADTWVALRDRWRRFGDVLHHHHEVEDAAIWPVLQAHAAATGDPGAAAMLTAMEDEHETIDPALAACTAAFDAMVSTPDEDHRNALDVHVTTIRAELLEHLAHEESAALPYLQRVMTAEEFTASEKAAEQAYPVLSLAFLIPWVAADAPPEAIDRMLADAGPAYRLLLRLFRPGFERRDRRAFKYA